MLASQPWRSKNARVSWLAYCTPRSECTSRPWPGRRWVLAICSALTTEFAAQMIGHRPADDLATPQIHDQRQIHPALGGRHISDVLEPDLIRAGGRRSLGQPVGRDGLVVVAVGGAGHKTRLGLRPQAMFVHQPGDPVFTALIAAGLKLFRHARTAVTGFLALPQGLDFCQRAACWLAGAPRVCARTKRNNRNGSPRRPGTVRSGDILFP